MYEVYGRRSAQVIRFLASAAVAGLGLPVVASAPAMAQAAAPDSGAAIETVTVTAQKRAENLQDVPIAISALSGESLSRNHINSLQDIAATVPGLVVTSDIGYGLAPITIRGLGGPNGGGSLFTDQPVAVYVDGAYVPTLAQSVSDLVDVSSVQVLRGPQGTLYGRNSTAGAILVTSRRPTTDFEAEAHATYSSYDSANLWGAVSGPLIQDKLLARLAVGYNSGGNWATDKNTGGKFGGGHSITGRGTLEFRPNDDVKIDLIVDAAHAHENPATVALAQVAQINAGPVLGTVYAGDPFARRSDFSSILDHRTVEMVHPQYVDTNANDYTLLVNWNLGGVTLDSVTAYRNMRLSGTQDASPGAVPAAVLGYNTSTQRTKNWSEELRLSSPDDVRFKWVGGVFYYHQDTDAVIDIVNLQAGPPVASLSLVPVPHPVFAGVPSGTTALFSGTQGNDAYAVFLDATYNLTDTLALTAGGRYSYEEKKAAITQSIMTLTPTILAGPVLAAGSCPAAGVPCTQSYHDFSPRAVVTYKPATDVMLYASYGRGFNSGGFNTFGNVSVLGDPTNPLETASETINSYEIGEKAEFLDGHLRLNMDGFLADYSNLQIRQAVYTGGVAVVNVPKAQVKGVEFDVTYVPVNRLTLSLNGSYLDARIEQGTLAALPSGIGAIIYGQSVAVTPQNVAGNSLTRAPKWQFNAGADYKWPASFGEVDFSADYRYESSVFYSETNQDTNAFKAKAWGEFDLRTGLTSNDGNWELAIFGRNLLDDRHITQVAPYNGFPIAALNQPRTIGISVTARY